MENTRALFLIEKSGLSEQDKTFIKKHLAMYEYLLHSLEIEILKLKDIIDYTKALDNKILSIKEQISSLTIEDKESFTNTLNKILKQVSK